MSRLHTAGEAAKLVELYTDHYAYMLRDHMEMVGSLGSTFRSVVSAKRALTFGCG